MPTKNTPKDAAALNALLRKGTPERVATFFAGMHESERQPFQRQVLDWCELIHLNYEASYSQKAARQLAQREKLKNHSELRSPAHTALVACGSLAQIKAIGFPWVPDEVLVSAWQDRKPAWIDEFVAAQLDQSMGRWSSSWGTVRALVRAGLCRPPASPGYSLGGIEGIWDWSTHNPWPPLVDLLLEERDWLETGFWGLFEFDGHGEVSLSNTEKYSKGRQPWTEALVELSKRGVLSRERLLDASLEALSRDFIQFRAGWFSRFHEALQPTPIERVARCDAYLNLLASSIPPTVAFALDAVVQADEAKPCRASTLLGALSPALAARGKAVVRQALDLLDRVAQREPKARPEIALAIAGALLHAAPEIQKRALDLLEQYGDSRNATLRERVGDAAGVIAASLRGRLKTWCDAPAAKAATTRKESSTAAAAPAKIPSRTDASRALQPVERLDDLLYLGASLLEDAGDPHDIERWLDGVGRLGAERPDDFAQRTGPLRKRAGKISGSQEPVSRALALLMLAWIDGTELPERTADALSHGHNQFEFLFRRLEILARFWMRRKALPLLSASTHRGGWIEPSILVKRWQAWQQAGETPDPLEQVLALLRLAPEGRQKALPSAANLKGEAGEALRFALGGPGRAGRDAALWLAAWRSRQPYGNLPEFEKVHPKLGPDAGVAAAYHWEARSVRNKYENSEWTSLELNVGWAPKSPRRVADGLLPVLWHGPFECSEEDNAPLRRWSSLLWPSQREAHFAAGADSLVGSVHYLDVGDRDLYPFLEPLAEPHTELRPMAGLALALGLAVEDSALRGHAQDALIAIVAEGRLNPELGDAMSRLLETGFNKLVRWSKSLGEVARVSPKHAGAVAELLQQAFHGDPTKAPRNLSALLELLVEVLSEIGKPLQDERARAYLAALKTGGKTARLVKELLGGK